MLWKSENSNQQVWSECCVINYFPTSLAQVMLGNIGPCLFYYRPWCAQSALPWSWQCRLSGAALMLSWEEVIFFCFEFVVLVFMAISVESFQWWLQGGCSRFEVDCKNCLWIKVKIIISSDVLMFMWLQIYKIIWSKGSEHQQYQADAWWFCCNRFLCEQYILV